MGDEIIEIRDPEIDVREIIRRIRNNLARRRAITGEDDTPLPTFQPLPDEGAPAGRALYGAIDRAEATSTRIYINMHLTPKGPPLLYRPWMALRRKAHELVLFYVNALAGKQTHFNTQVVAALKQFAKELEEASRQEEEIARLKERVERLEKSLGSEGKG